MPEFKLKITIDGRQAAVVVMSADDREEAIRQMQERIKIDVQDFGPRGSDKRKECIMRTRVSKSILSVSRRLRSQEVIDVAETQEFQELVEPVQEAVVQQMGEVVMQTVDQIAGPLEEVLDRPLTEEEVADVQEVATEIVQDSLDQATEGIAETVEAPEEKENGDEAPMEGSIHRRFSRKGRDRRLAGYLR